MTISSILGKVFSYFAFCNQSKITPGIYAMEDMVYKGKDYFRMGEARFRQPMQMNSHWMNVLQEFIG